MTCKCGFHLNPPNTPCKCDGKRPECDEEKEFFCLDLGTGKMCSKQCLSCSLDEIRNKVLGKRP